MINPNSTFFHCSTTSPEASSSGITIAVSSLVFLLNSPPLSLSVDCLPTEGDWRRPSSYRLVEKWVDFGFDELVHTRPTNVRALGLRLVRNFLAHLVRWTRAHDTVVKSHVPPHEPPRNPHWVNEGLDLGRISGCCELRVNVHDKRF